MQMVQQSKVSRTHAHVYSTGGISFRACMMILTSTCSPADTRQQFGLTQYLFGAVVLTLKTIVLLRELRISNDVSRVLPSTKSKLIEFAGSTSSSAVPIFPPADTYMDANTNIHTHTHTGKHIHTHTHTHTRTRTRAHKNQHTHTDEEDTRRTNAHTQTHTHHKYRSSFNKRLGGSQMIPACLHLAQATSKDLRAPERARVKGRVSCKSPRKASKF